MKLDESAFLAEQVFTERWLLLYKKKSSICAIELLPLDVTFSWIFVVTFENFSPTDPYYGGIHYMKAGDVPNRAIDLAKIEENDSFVLAFKKLR